MFFINKNTEQSNYQHNAYKIKNFKIKKYDESMRSVTMYVYKNFQKIFKISI